MNVSRTRQFISNMGNYGERYQASVTVTMSHHDLGYSDEEWVQQVNDLEQKHPEEGTQKAFEIICDEVMDAVDAELADEIEEANRLRPAGEESFLDPKKTKKRTRRRST